MKKVFTKFAMIIALVVISFGAMAQVEIANPKGSKGVIANFTGFDIGKQLEKQGEVDLSLGFVGYYFFRNNTAICPGINFGAIGIHDEPQLQKTLDFSIGLRQWLFNTYWFVGGWYQGITSNNIKTYENAMMFDVGYTKFLSNEFKIFVEPTIYWQKSFGDFDINRLGFMISLGLNF
jgi:hypothetical protein